ncbi:MAG: cupin domain-containing protein [Gaiellales bacterium]
MPRTPLREGEHGLVPEGEGWFVVNAREAEWRESPDFGRFCGFEGEARFPQYGVNIHVLAQGKPNCMYHGENEQEDFLVLSGECLLLIEGEERRLRAWDFVHCPAWTEHVFVGTSAEPCAILMIGTRNPGSGVRYPRSELALRHRAGVEQETASPAEAYAGSGEERPIAYRAGDLPGG